MINFEKWYYNNEKIIEEGIYYTTNNGLTGVRLNFKNDNNKNTIIKLCPAEFFFNTNIIDPYRKIITKDLNNKPITTDNIVDSLFGGIVVHDEENENNEIGSGNKITSILYHLCKYPYLTDEFIKANNVSDKSKIKGYQKLEDISQANTGLTYDIKTYHSNEDKDSDKKYVTNKIPLKFDIINVIEQYAIQGYINEILPKSNLNNITFDRIFYPKSKSEHVDKFAKLCISKIPSNNTPSNKKSLSTYKIDKKSPETLLKQINEGLPDLNKLLTDNQLNDRSDVSAKLYAMFEYCYNNFTQINKNLSKILLNDSELPKFIPSYKEMSNEKLNILVKMYKCILFVACWYKYYNKINKFDISSANDIRVICNIFSRSNEQANKKVKSFIIQEIENYNKSNPENFIELTNGSISISSKMTGVLDAFISNYYKPIEDNDTDSVKNILCIDDNINIGSTVYEVTRVLKEKYPNAKVHWIVLFIPMNDIINTKNNYGGASHICTYPMYRIQYKYFDIEKTRKTEEYNNYIDTRKQRIETANSDYKSLLLNYFNQNEINTLTNNNTFTLFESYEDIGTINEKCFRFLRDNLTDINNFFNSDSNINPTTTLENITINALTCISDNIDYINKQNITSICNFIKLIPSKLQVKSKISIKIKITLQKILTFSMNELINFYTKCGKNYKKIKDNISILLRYVYIFNTVRMFWNENKLYITPISINSLNWYTDNQNKEFIKEQIKNFNSWINTLKFIPPQIKNVLNPDNN